MEFGMVRGAGACMGEVSTSKHQHQMHHSLLTLGCNLVQWNYLMFDFQFDKGYRGVL
jgi:hypothetical protein